MESLSIEGLRNRMMIQRDKRIQTAIREIVEGIQKAADEDLTNFGIRILPRRSIHIMLHVYRLDDDIAEDVYTQLQPYLGDIRRWKNESAISFEW